MPQKSRHQNSVLLFIPIFILVYLLPLHAAVAAPSFPQPLRRQAIPQPSSPGAGTPGSTWTNNYWWPFPPAGSTTVIPAATTTVTATTTGQNPISSLPTPFPSSTSTDDEQNQSMSDSSNITSTPTTSNPASSITSSTISPTSSTSLSHNNNDGETPPNAQKHFNILYLIPVFSFVGLLALIGIGWLIHGCCTRKPKYRPSYSRPVSRNRAYGLASGSDAFGYGNSKEGKELGLAPDASEATFRAFRYEDFSVDPGHQYTFDDPVWDTGASGGTATRCQHTREYGFECDCRQSVIESDQIQFRWPRTQLEDILDEEEPGEVDAQEPKYFPTRTRTDQSPKRDDNPRETLTTLDILSDSCSDPDFTSEYGLDGEDADEKDRLRDGYFDARAGTGRVGRQGRILEGVQLEDRKRERIPRRGVTKKSRRMSKSAKSVKRSKTSGSAWTERSVYSHDDDGEGEEGHGEEDGFRMAVESPPLLPGDGNVKPLRVSIGREVHDVGEGSMDRWMGKMAGAVGSSLSRLSGGSRDEDKYTALPEPPNRMHPTPSPRKKLRKTRKRPQSKAPNQTNQTLQKDESTETVMPDYDLTEEEIAAQKRRLQSHRASIASLPAGMVFSPPLVGVCVFGEDAGLGPGTSSIAVRDKLLPKVPQ